ncbi:hypothetical protein ES703_111391 [subsurface metagenome]
MRYLKLIGLTIVAILLYFVGMFVLLLAAPFSSIARNGLSGLASGRTAKGD